MANGLLTLDNAVLEGGIADLIRFTGTEPLENVVRMANLLKNSGDSNKQIEDLTQNCVKMQEQYNAYADSTEELIKELGKLVDLSNLLSRKDIGGVSTKDTSYEGPKLDVNNSKLLQ